jgi:cephalosporin hydroxylase
MKNIYLRNTPENHGGILETYSHYEIIQHLAKWIKPINYLEIGVRHGNVYNLVKEYCNQCYLVDIDFLDIDYSNNTLKFEMLSDIFFEMIDTSIKFDLVFIDGDHSKEQVLKDFINVKNMVVDDSFVILHDTYPCDERMELPYHSHNAWEAVLEIKKSFIDEWELITLPFNPGLTIMKKMKNNKQLLWK